MGRAIICDIDGTLSDPTHRLHHVTGGKKNWDAVVEWSDKEVGLALGQWPENVRRFIFPYRKSGGDLLRGKARESLFRHVRPTGNLLAGYTPSYAMNRILDDSL